MSNTRKKIYNSFADVSGNSYSFDNYMDFAKFWFAIPYQSARQRFGSNFKALQNAAANSKEARTKINID